MGRVVDYSSTPCMGNNQKNKTSMITFLSCKYSLFDTCLNLDWSCLFFATSEYLHEGVGTRNVPLFAQFIPFKRKNYFLQTPSGQQFSIVETDVQCQDKIAFQWTRNKTFLLFLRSKCVRIEKSCQKTQFFCPKKEAKMTQHRKKEKHRHEKRS